MRFNSSRFIRFLDSIISQINDKIDEKERNWKEKDRSRTRQEMEEGISVNNCPTVKHE